MPVQLEARLRPAYELWPAGAYTFAILGVLSFPQVFMLPPVLSGVAIIAFGLLALRRAVQAAAVIRYRRGLTYPSHSVLDRDAIPTPPGKLFLGWGFEWTE